MPILTHPHDEEVQGSADARQGHDAEAADVKPKGGKHGVSLPTIDEGSMPEESEKMILVSALT